MTPEEQNGFIEELEHEPKEPLWYIEFRSFGPGDYHIPLMHIPLQRTYVRGTTPTEAKNEVCSWDRKADIRFVTVELAP